MLRRYLYERGRRAPGRGSTTKRAREDRVVDAHRRYTTRPSLAQEEHMAANGGGKRTRVDEEEVDELRMKIFDYLTSVLPSDPRNTQDPDALAKATMTELGVTSTMAMGLKGFVFHQLHAELTNFQLMKSPTAELLELIVAQRKQDVGLMIPEFESAVPAPA